MLSISYFLCLKALTCCPFSVHHKHFVRKSSCVRAFDGRNKFIGKYKNKVYKRKEKQCLFSLRCFRHYFSIVVVHSFLLFHCLFPWWPILMSNNKIVISLMLTTNKQKYMPNFTFFLLFFFILFFSVWFGVPNLLKYHRLYFLMNQLPHGMLVKSIENKRKFNYWAWENV